MSATQSSDLDPELSRRGFLTVLSRALLWTSGVGGLWMLVRFLGFETEPAPQTLFVLEPPQAYPEGSVTIVPQARAALYHDRAGFFALSLICTHLGCTVEQNLAGYLCPCHGSRFDEGGFVQNGPAVESLHYIAVGLEAEGRLFLDLSREVEAEGRLFLDLTQEVEADVRW